MRKLISVSSFLALAFAAMNAQAAAVSLINDGFEAPWDTTSFVGQDNDFFFNYSPTGSNLGWTFGVNTGVVTTKTSLVPAPEGDHYAFLQFASGLISQTFNVSQSGNADLSFLYGLRPLYESGQALNVYLDGNLVNTFSTQTGWNTGTLSLGFLSAGNHIIGFAGTGNINAGDTTVFLDKVAINVSSVPEPTSALMLSLGLGGLLLARRRQA